MKKKIGMRIPKTAELEEVKGGFIVIEDNVMDKDQGDKGSEYIVIEDVIFRDAP